MNPRHTNSTQTAPTHAEVETLAAQWCVLLQGELERLEAGRVALQGLRAAAVRRDGDSLRAIVAQQEQETISPDRASAQRQELLKRTATVLRVGPDNVKLSLLADRCPENTRRRLLDLAGAVRAAAVEAHALRRGNQALLEQSSRLFSELLVALGHADDETGRYDANGRRQCSAGATVVEATC
jgi:hypothetical protein